MKKSESKELLKLNNMIRIFLFSLALLVFFSCKTKPTSKAPGDLIPEDKFVQVLSEVRLLEAAYSVKFDRVDTTTGIGTYYSKLFQQNGLTKEQFENSFRYYAAHQEIMIGIETKVLDRLSQLNTEVKTQADAAPADSLRPKPTDVKTNEPFQELKK